MATLTERRNSKGELTGWKVTACIGRDQVYRQVWASCTIKRDHEGITATTPKAMEKQAKRIADEWAEQQKAEFAKNGKTQKISKDKVTLANFIRNKWLPLHVHDGEHTPTTVAFYDNMAADIIAYFGEHIHISEIDGEVIKKYQIHLRTKAKTKQGKPYSETTVKRHMETLRNVLNFATAQKYIKVNPFADTPITSSTKKEQKTIDFLSPAECAQFLDALSGESLQWECFMRILLYCGLRRGECTALTWRDIDLENNRILVRRNCTVDQSDEKGYSLGSTKSGKQRIVYPTETIAALLRQFQAEQTGKYGPLSPDWFLFHTPADPARPIYPTSSTTWLARFMKKNGMRPISPHDLRHSCGTLQKMAGVPLKDIAANLGHSDTRTTNRYYVEFDDATQRRAGSEMEKLISDAK